jgi:site-specific DNA-methyltransferase (adenine-specific)
MPDECVDLVMADPPYRIEAHMGGNKDLGAGSSRMDYGDGAHFVPYDEWLPQAYRLLRPSKCLLMWEYPGAVAPAVHAMEAAGFTVLQTVVWHVRTRRTYGSRSARPGSTHDIGLLALKGDLPIARVDGELPPYDCTDPLQPHMTDKRISGRLPGMKPDALLRPWIRWLVPPGGRVLDPFLGSGSTLLAAWKEGRDGIGIELLRDRKALIRDRLRAGQKQLEAFG